MAIDAEIANWLTQIWKTVDAASPFCDWLVEERGSEIKSLQDFCAVLNEGGAVYEQTLTNFGLHKIYAVIKDGYVYTLHLIGTGTEACWMASKYPHHNNFSKRFKKLN